MNLLQHILRSAALTAALTAALALPVAAQEAQPEADAAPAEVSADTVIATVNGKTITLGHMIAMRARLPQEYQSIPDPVLYSGILEQLIQQLAISDAHPVDLSKGSELALENERRSFQAGEALGEIGRDALSDEAVAQLYERLYANAAPVKEYNAAHILLETEEEAIAVKAEVEGGADFAEVAKARSTGPSGPNGGSLGWFSQGMMVETFEQAVVAMEPGQISDPVQTQFGWHVIQLIEVRNQDVPALADVTDDLTEEVKRMAMDVAVTQALDAATIERAELELDPAILRNLDLLND